MTRPHAALATTTPGLAVVALGLAAAAPGIACSGDYPIASLVSAGAGTGPDTTSGSGAGDDGVCATCPGLTDPVQDHAQDPRVDGYLRGVLQFRTTVDKARITYQTRLVALANDWGYSSGITPNPADVTALLARISEELAASTEAGLELLADPLRCGANTQVAITEQVRCATELGCEFDSECVRALSPADTEVQCKGTCVGLCGDACEGLALCDAQGSPGIACAQLCIGTCELLAQQCPGLCTGECDDELDFCGVCGGACTGTCTLVEGGQCLGRCTGECLGLALDPVCPTAPACVQTCPGPCGGACIGEPSPAVAAACGTAPCNATAACNPTASLRGAVDVRCASITVTPRYLPAAGLSPAQRAALDARVLSLQTHLPFLLETHAELSLAVRGDAVGVLVEAEQHPAPAAKLSTTIIELWQSNTPDVPCPACTHTVLAEAVVEIATAVDDAEALAVLGDLLLVGLGLD